MPCPRPEPETRRGFGTSVPDVAEPNFVEDLGGHRNAPGSISYFATSSGPRSRVRPATSRNRRRLSAPPCRAHASAGHDLIAVDGKKPVASGWRRIAALSSDDAKARMARGGNVGVRLRETDLVVDVDTRHFAAGDDPLARLKADFGLPDAPFVRTGGGGLHIYMRKPGDVTVRGKLDLFEGIEFKSVGFQVVAAGSIHPETGKPYCLDDDVLALSLSEAPEAPTALLDAIAKPSASSLSSEAALGEQAAAHVVDRRSLANRDHAIAGPCVGHSLPPFAALPPSCRVRRPPRAP